MDDIFLNKVCIYLLLTITISKRLVVFNVNFYKAILSYHKYAIIRQRKFSWIEGSSSDYCCVNLVYFHIFYLTLFSVTLSQSSEECKQAKKCGECVSMANCFWCSESNYGYNASCYPQSSTTIRSKCWKIEDPSDMVQETRNEDIDLGIAPPVNVKLGRRKNLLKQFNL